MGRKAAEVSQKQYERNEKIYNLRSREISYLVGQDVFRRYFKQSSFEHGYNAKLAPTFVKALYGGSVVIAFMSWKANFTSCCCILFNIQIIVMALAPYSFISCCVVHHC